MLDIRCTKHEEAGGNDEVGVWRESLRQREYGVSSDSRDGRSCSGNT